MKKYRRALALLTVFCLALALLSGCASGKKETAAAPAQTPQSAAEQTPAPRDPSRDLLLVVDFQNVYLPGNEWACPSMPEAMKNTMRILAHPGR